MIATGSNQPKDSGPARGCQNGRRGRVLERTRSDSAPSLTQKHNAVRYHRKRDQKLRGTGARMV